MTQHMYRLLAALMPKGAAGGTLTQKGYGHVYGASDTANLAMSYAKVDGGSAPAAGDLVVWFVFGGDSAASPIVDLTSSGWAQGTNYFTGGEAATILAKVVSSGDLSSPPTVVSAPTSGSIGFWVAYTIAGSVSSLSVGTVNNQYSNTSAPSNQTVDCSSLNSPDVGILIGAGGGNDGSPSMSVSGMTADINFTTAANVWLFGGGETRFLAAAIVGGANVTFSKSDDGSFNHMASGYVSVTF